MSAFPPASLQKTTTDYYLQTSTGFNKPMAFCINPKTTKDFLEHSLNDIQLKKPTIVYNNIQHSHPPVSRRQQLLQTSTRFNKTMAFRINPKITKNVLEYFLNDIQLKKPTNVYK